MNLLLSVSILVKRNRTQILFDKTILDMRNFIVFGLLLGTILGFTSCNDFDEKAIEVAGFYDANVVNGLYNFELQISLDGNDDVLIDALFDDYDFEVVRADLDDHRGGLIDFDIPSQTVYGGATLRGDGEYIDGFLQLDYTIDWGFERVTYRIVADRY